MTVDTRSGGNVHALRPFKSTVALQEIGTQALLVI